MALPSYRSIIKTVIVAFFVVMIVLIFSGMVVAIGLVCIDPGHGGRDPGATSSNSANFGFVIDLSTYEITFISDGTTNTASAVGYVDGEINSITGLPNRINSAGNLELWESDANLDISLRLRDMLVNEGHETLMTRDSDIYPTLTDRCDIANNANATIFVSVHNNAYTTETANGTETYHFPGSFFGELLANCIQDELMEQISTYDRGVKSEDDFRVLNGTNMPAVLVEGAFISNPNEAKLLLTPTFRQNIAQGIFNGIEKYYTLGHYFDVMPGYWAYIYIERLAEEGIVGGFSDGSFAPAQNIKRAEFAKIICEAKGWTLLNPSVPSFSDVSQSHWAYQYIETAKVNGAISGYSDETFRPENDITRAEITKMIAVSAGLSASNVESVFSDVALDHWACKFILSCRDGSIVDGYEDGTFKPDACATRAEVAKMIYTMLGF